METTRREAVGLVTRREAVALMGGAVAATAAVLAGAAPALGAARNLGSGIETPYTLVVLCHEDHKVYELDMSNGKVLHVFEAPNQPHEAAFSADGRTVYVAIPQAAFVIILDGSTFKEKGRIETDLFKRPPQQRPAGSRGAGGPPNTSASPHGMALNNEGTKLYIGVESAEIPGIVVYDTKSGKVVKKIDTVLEGGHYLQIQPKTDKLDLSKPH